MSNYSIEEFLGIFLLFVPLYLFLIVALQRGIIGLFEDLFEELKRDDRLKNVFHHHYHYKARRD